LAAKPLFTSTEFVGLMAGPIEATARGTLYSVRGIEVELGKLVTCPVMGGRVITSGAEVVTGADTAVVIGADTAVVTGAAGGKVMGGRVATGTERVVGGKTTGGKVDGTGLVKGTEVARGITDP
jgi:hypothetical protein